MPRAAVIGCHAPLPDGVCAVDGPMSKVYLLHHQRRFTLIDAGLNGEHAAVENILARFGLGWDAVDAILLTHAHLDHVGNARRWQRLSGAPVWLHPEERDRLHAYHPYRGWNRLCGAAERLGRWAINYRPPQELRTFQPEQELAFAGGLRVIPLPGHTDGHVGFYSARLDVLFCGDLFADTFGWAHTSPFIYNSCPERFPEAFQRVAALNPGRVLPAHAKVLDAQRLHAGLRRVAARRGVTIPPIENPGVRGELG